MSRRLTMRVLVLLLWLLCLTGAACQSSVEEPPSNATDEWNTSDGIDRILLSSTYAPLSTSASNSLTPSIFSAPTTPFLHPLLAVGDVVSAVPTLAIQRGSRFQLVEFLQAIPASQPSSSSTRSAGLLPSVALPSSSAEKSLSFAPTVLRLRADLQSPSSLSHALVSASDSLSLRQFERLVSLPYLSLAPSYLDADDTLLQSALSSTIPASVPAVTQATKASTSPSSASFDYTLHSRIGRGGYGELWKARKLPTTTTDEEEADSSDSADSDEYFILKRLLIEKGEHVRASGLREIHFGQLLADQPHVARFIEWFEVRGELWLVFRHEGLSLADYMRRVEVAAHGGAAEEAGREVLTPEWQMLREDMMSDDERWAWKARRRRESRQTDTDPLDDDDDVEHDTVDLDLLEHPIPSLLPPSSAASSALSALSLSASPPLTPASRGLPSSSSSSPSPSGLPAGSLLRDLLHQIMTAVAEGHRMGITHRDIKPPNILLKLHRHHPHHRFMQHRHSHDFLSVDEETNEQQQSDLHHNETDEMRHAHSHDLPAPNATSGTSPTSSSSSSSSSSLSSPPSSASFSFAAALSSLGHVRLCDYGSATDASEEVNQRLYGDDGPSPLESTIDYAPPELLFASSMSPSSSSSSAASLLSFFSPSYDSWSLGVLILELLLGSRERVFALDNRVKALIQARLGHKVREDVVEKAILFRAFIEYCIYPAAGAAAEQSTTNRADELPYATGSGGGGCNHTHVGEMLRRYDPLGVGLGELGEFGMGQGQSRGESEGTGEGEGQGEGEEAVGRGGGGAERLNVLLYGMVRGLLQWHPHLRLSVEDALHHAYFHGDWYRCAVCGREFELPAQLQAHAHTHVESTR